MAALYITEYQTMGQVNFGGQMPQEPPIAEQVVAIGGLPASSNPFNKLTRFVRVEADAICSILFGTAPAVSTASGRFAAGQTEYRAVPEGGNFVVAVIANT
jgi:hypothetical protein